jgi:hypothetical protein
MKSLLDTLSKNKRRMLYAFLIGLLLWSVYKYQFFNSAWIMLTYCGAFVLAFIVVAPMLLPIDSFGKERRPMRDRFLRFLTGERLLFIVVREGKVVVPVSKEKRSKAKEPIEGPWVYGRSAILTDSTSVIVMKTETGISRVIGPGSIAESRSESGVIFTFYTEQVDSVIDLRPQMRTEMIEAQTRDGILVKVRVTAFFTLKGTKARRSIDMTPAKPHPFTWRQASVREAFHNKRIEYVDGKPEQIQQTQWSDRVMQIAIAELRQLIARHSLDYLTAPLLADRHPRFELRRELLGIVQQRLDASNIIQEQPNTSDELKRGSGIEVRFIAVSLIWPPPPVVEQRIEAWKKEWLKKETEVMGRAKAQALITKEQARATAQGELTARINDALQAAKASGTTSSDLVALRFLEVMDKMAKDPTTRALLTLDSLSMLNRLREMLKSDGSDEAA